MMPHMPLQRKPRIYYKWDKFISKVKRIGYGGKLSPNPAAARGMQANNVAGGRSETGGREGITKAHPRRGCQHRDPHPS